MELNLDEESEELNPYDEAIDLIRYSRNNKIYLPLSYPMGGDTIGLAKQRYFLLGGHSGTGKSAFAHWSFVLGAYNSWKTLKQQNHNTFDLDIEVFALERPTNRTLVKWITSYLFYKHKILIDTKKLMNESRGDPVGEEVLQKVEEGREYFESLFKVVKIHSIKITPTEFYKYCTKKALSLGKIVQSSGKLNSQKYIEHNSNALRVIIVDHIGLFKKEKGQSKKEMIDLLSEYIRALRDTYGFSVIVVSQFNRGMADTTRRTKIAMTPEPEDFKDSGNTFEDCDICLGLFNPYRYGMIDYLGYDIMKLIHSNREQRKVVKRFRSIHVLKNTYGDDGIVLPMLFVGEIGSFHELPRVEEFDKTPTLYQSYANLTKLIGSAYQTYG
jgi:hypothetical protein